MQKKVFSVIFIIFALNNTLPAKDTVKYNYYTHNYGHADDIAKLLTGKGYVNNSTDPLNVLETGLAYLMHLVVDSRIKKDGIPFEEGYEAMRYLDDHKKELKISGIPNLKEFTTPGGNIHGVYSHLGWNHVYTETIADYGQEIIYVNRAWRIRKKLLCDALGKIFDFGILEGRKKEALGALFYYVHILGDHEENKLKTADTRIPILSLDEQGILNWGSDPYWIPQTTIIDELQIYLPILFSDQKHTFDYMTMMNEIERFNVFTVVYVDEETNEVYSFTSRESQMERAKHLLQLLFDHCPYLLSRESFAKNLYQKYNIILN